MLTRWLQKDDGSVELIALGLLAALIVVLAIPLFDISDKVEMKQVAPAVQEQVAPK